MKTVNLDPTDEGNRKSTL